MTASLAAFENALKYVVSEASRLHTSGIPVDTAISKAGWGAYAAWTASDRNGPVAVQRVYDALDGKLK